jgi:hypothetical protein
MSTEKKKPFKRDQALNDATSGQFGEEPLDISEEHSAMQEYEDQRKKLPENFQKISNDYFRIVYHAN